ncbi:hypothetical protein D0962_34600 [Leptolyngbyaceae cyanobacterium CCMR0082]|uniref:Uncharacterized protein n=2 Tax=Adonisia TaxID=2950183 RepID=A0A6M0SGY5_9CYAN|nr:hypothetical protein [Adonisia turfae CCMR0082]
MGVGRSVGAITCAVDYIEKALHNPAASEILFKGTGGINHPENHPGKIEALVLFTSKEIIERNPQFPAHRYEGTSQPEAARTEIEKVLRKVWKTSYPERKIFWCEVDIDNYEDCFEKVVKATYRFSPLKKQGKEIWCNLTSGSDSLGLALLSMSELTAKSTKRYLLSQKQDYRSFVTVPPQIKLLPNRDNYFRLLPFIKKTIDVFEFYEILAELENTQKLLRSSELFNRLRSRNLFTNLDEDSFTRQYLIKIYSLGYTELLSSNSEQKNKQQNKEKQDQDKYVALTEMGVRFLNEELEELKSLVDFEDILSYSPEDIVDISKHWPWFYETVL